VRIATSVAGRRTLLSLLFQTRRHKQLEEKEEEISMIIAEEETSSGF
jgi:hypothetical protein